MQRVTTRHIGMAQVEEVDEWLTSQVSIITTHPQENVFIQTGMATNLGSGVIIEPHPSLQATARLTTVSQSTRDVAQILPPILRDNTQPFQFTASRGVDPGLSVLELQVGVSNADSLNTVTPDQPLKLSVAKALADNEYILPVAYDGEFFVPLGRGETKEGKTEIRLERLCYPLAEKKRSLGGAVRIFFQKIVADKLGFEYPYPLLAAVEYGEDGTIRYRAETEVVKQKVAVANKIVLFIHGIIGDTQSIVPCARQTNVVIHEQDLFLSELYDLVLTFDYENLNTPIGTVAEQLGQRLEAVGLGVEHEKLLHIIAHSMGGLVARSFIEQKGGKQVVQHLIMLGTPNGGSPWSTVQDWATTALAIGINSLSVIAFPVRILGNLVAAIETIDINLDQMKPGSDFLTALRDCPDPGIPYTVLAGNTSIIPPPDAETANKLQTFLANLGRGTVEFPFLGQPNDIAVSVSSIKHIPEGRVPPPQVYEVACNHLVYFQNSKSLTALAETIGDIFSSPPESLILSSPVVFEEPSTRESEDQPPIEARVETTSSTNRGLNYVLIGAVVLLSAVVVAGVVIWQQSQPEDSREFQDSSQLLQ
jgi:pimeloyl-ACP methyl ester carboxylesterase